MNRSTVEEIKARLPIEDVIGGYIKLDRSGRSFKAKCPFHNEKTASFFVSPDRGGYYCFGCGAKGDIFSFVEQFEGLDFRGALKVLADKAGVKLQFDQKADGERDRLLGAMTEAEKFFSDCYGKSAEAGRYVQSRGISDKTRLEFRIGYAPAGWQNAREHLHKKGYVDAILEKAGLIKAQEGVGSRVEGAEGRGSRYYDRFRDRIMFPIADSSGRVIAFSGRILHDDGKSAKYLNSPDTPLYDKSQVLYGLDKAKAEIRRLNYSVMVEGQMDLVLSHQCGVRNAVAASGTALTDEVADSNGVVSNLGLLRRLSPNVIIAFDADAAGRKAAMRAAAIALGLGMDVKIADVSSATERSKPAKDPADLILENPEHWRGVLRSAKPVVEFELDNVIKEVSNKRKLSEAINGRVLPLVANIESANNQSYFVQMIADKARIPTDTVWQDLRVISDRLDADRRGSPGANRPQMSHERTKRIDLVERRLFGLFYLMEKADQAAAEKLKQRIVEIAADSSKSRMERASQSKDDLMFEAEVFFGDNRTSWDKQADELASNFEEDIINEELIAAMSELKAAENAGDSARAEVMARKCQELSLRKAGISRKRKS